MRNRMGKYIQIIKCHVIIKTRFAKVFSFWKYLKMRARGTSNKSVNFLRLDAITSSTTVSMCVCVCVVIIIIIIITIHNKNSRIIKQQILSIIN